MLSMFGWSLSVRINIQKQSTPLVVDKKTQERLLKSYSQFNEDLFLYQLFEGNKNGYYVDIGANHPVNLSNTKKYFDIGWSGVNVEPNPKLHKQFCECRPQDLNLNCGVGDVDGEMTFYEIDPDCYSTFDKKTAEMTRVSSSKKLVSKLPVKIITINYIFSLCKNQVDFLSVDTESFDYKVLSVNDWSRNRPKVIIVELNSDKNNEVHNLLIRNGYNLILFNGTNGIFVSSEFAAQF